VAWAAIDPGDGAPGSEMLAVGCSRAEYTLCEQLPGMNYRKSDQIWRAPLSWQAWVAFKTLWASQPIDVHPKLAAWGASRWRHIEFSYELRSALNARDQAELLIDKVEEASPGRQLRPFQRGGAQWLRWIERGLLEDPQGNGKTPQIIRALQITAHLPALIVCPGAAVRNWERELHAWAPELTVKTAAGAAGARRKALAEGEDGFADVYVMPWADVRLHTRLARYPGQEFVKCDEHGGSTGKSKTQCELCLKELNDIPFGTIIADEAHRMKDARSKQTRAVWWLAHHAHQFWAATGTPVADDISDLWPIMHGCDPKGFPSRSKYLDLFAVKALAWHNGEEILGIRPDTADAFQACVQPLIRRIPREVARPEQPDRLPPVFRYPVLPPAQRKLYKQLKAEMEGELDNGTSLVPANTAVLFGRLCQLAASDIETYNAEDRDGFTIQKARMVAPSHKADDLLEYLNDNPGQLVVAANSPQLIAIAEDKLAKAKITSCKVVGGMDSDACDQAVQWFQTGKCRVIFINSAGSEAITLTASDTIFFIQPDPSFLVTEQKIGRVDRIGQKFPVRVVYSITPGTVEERLYELSVEKRERAAEVTRDADLMRWMISDAGV
jgi:SNF2 family DNA or RNA helicase